MNKNIIKATAVTGALLLALTACGGGAASAKSEKQEIADKAATFSAYKPKNNVELENYNRSQELYDDPAAIQWCSAFPSSASAPIITLPIAGKLTTSSTSYFSPTEIRDRYDSQMNIPARSVDGLFHGDSFYRYGFTPAGQYVDYSNSLELLCTTSLTEFQRQNTFVEGVNTDKGVDVAANQKAAEAALKDGDGDKAAAILGGK